MYVNEDYAHGGALIASYHFDTLYRDYFILDTTSAENVVWNPLTNSWDHVTGKDNVTRISEYNTAPTFVQYDGTRTFWTWSGYDRLSEVEYFDRMRDNYTGQTTDASQVKYYPVAGAETEPAIYQSASDLDRTEWYGYVMSLETRLQGLEWALDRYNYANATESLNAAVNAIGNCRYEISAAAFNCLDNRPMSNAVAHAWRAVQNYTLALCYTDLAMLDQYMTTYPQYIVGNEANWIKERAEIVDQIAQVRGFGDEAPDYAHDGSGPIISWLTVHYRVVLGGISIVCAAIALFTRHPLPIVLTVALLCVDAYLWAGELL